MDFKDFCSPDITQPLALPIDFIFAKFEDGKLYHTVKFIGKLIHTKMTDSAFIIGQMPNPDIEYSFDVRIDGLIKIP